MKYLLLPFTFLFASCLHGQSLIKVDELMCTMDSLPYSGSYTTFHANGLKSAIYNFSEGMLNAGVYYFDEQGKLCMTGFFADNKPDGLWQSWSPMGVSLSSARYERGKKVGLWTIRYAETDPEYVLIYSNNELIEARKSDH